MLAFGTGTSTASSAADAARAAVRQACEAAGAPPKVVVVFSAAGSDRSAIDAVLHDELGDLPIVGGTAGGAIFAHDTCSQTGATVIALGGDDLEVAVESVPLDVLAIVPAAENIRRAADDAARRGLNHYTCLVFAPGWEVDGDALVAAVRKGAGERAQLAGCLAGDDLQRNEPLVFAEGKLRSDRVVIAGLFTRNAVGIAARHGWRPIGPARTITRIDGADLFELDGKPALDVWLADAQHFGPQSSAGKRGLELHLNQYPIGLVDAALGRKRRSSEELDDGRELLARAAYLIRDDGSIRLSAAVGEGRIVRVMHAARDDLLNASDDAATAARAAAGRGVAGALVLSCSGRLLTLGDRFGEEPAGIAKRVAAPIAGACVYGEIARNIRDADAFFNTTAVVVAFGTR